MRSGRRDTLGAGDGATRDVALIRFAEKLSSATDLAELQQTFLSGFGRLMAVSMWGFNVIDPATAQPKHIAAANVSDTFVARYQRDAMHVDPVLAHALTTGKAAYNKALMSDEEWLASPVYQGAYYMHGVRHVVEVPLFAGQCLVGNLHFARTDPDYEFTPQDLLLAEAVGRLIAGAIERVESQEHADRERARALTALELAGTATVVSDPGATELRFNDAARVLLAQVADAEEHVHGLLARHPDGGGFARRAEVDLIDGGVGVLHGHAGHVDVDGGGVVTVLELERDQPSIPAGLLAGLTARESEVAALVVDGLADREIADRLALSHHTVSQYVKRIYRKLGVGSRVALTRLLLRPRDRA